MITVLADFSLFRLLTLKGHIERDTLKFKPFLEILFYVMLFGYVHTLQNCALEMQPEQQINQRR